MVDIINLSSQIVGWAYFVAWSVSFYPQVYENWKRKSVIGLSFDFLALNITGWISYSLFNCLIYWEPLVQNEYLEKLGPPLPMQLNDIVFGLHAFVLTCITITQCLIYERGDQKVSELTILILSGVATAAAVQLFLCLSYYMSWLDYLFFFSYVKVGATLLKYIPQAYKNYERQSTEGWSIGNILLDTTGGVLSFLQVFIDGFGSGNWKILEGAGSKLALALISLLFDLIFIIQHYCLYRHKSPYKLIK